eukprot:12417474-Karenia_brevis.AAC.1
MQGGAASSAQAQHGEVIRCGSCGLEKAEESMTRVQSENVYTGTSEQPRCRDCNAVKSRVHRITKHSQFLKLGYQDLKGEARVTLFKEAANLC